MLLCKCNAGTSHAAKYDGGVNSQRANRYRMRKRMALAMSLLRLPRGLALRFRILTLLVFPIEPSH